MAINLGNLNISLDKFNTESSGVLNIGQIKLSSDGKSVYRTNNHKTWTILNRTKISSEEALAVKFAFCNALKKEGLSQEAIDAVKARLGIPGNELDALKAGNIKPLTAAEVREVIDRYAGQINERRASAANGAKALRTSAEIYRGVGKKEMEARATTRDEINAKSIDKLMTGTDRAVDNLLDMLQSGGRGDTISLSSKALAREIMTKLGNPGVFGGKKKSIVMASAPIQFALQEDGKITARFILDNGNVFSMDTGLDRNGLVEKAADLINAAVASEPRPRVEQKSDDGIMKAINELEPGEIETEEAKPQRRERVMSNEVLLGGLRDVFDALKSAIPDRRRALRNANMENVVTALQKALDRVRPLDDRNTKIINDVREVFYGNKGVDADKLLKSISDVLGRKRVDPGDKIEKNLLNNIQDNLDENLNINAWLGDD